MIVGTAGHIDHGKTTLVRALTGVDTDRLPEEKKRGISIELGYAFLDLPDAPRIGFVDAPGHERLVHTMLAGATGIDFALMLVAADDGVMPQTREHLTVLALLGLSRGIVVITKCDRVEAQRVDAVRAEVASLLQATALCTAPVLAVSAHSGQGLGELRQQLREAALQTGAHPRRTQAFRLAVDRSFTLAGVGTVVTGTVHAGAVGVGDMVQLVPGGRQLRVRSLHAQNRVVDRAWAGQRCAMGLAGIEKDQVARGQWLVDEAAAQSAVRLDVWLELWHAEPRPLKSGTTVHVHMGSATEMGMVVMLDPPVLEPGGQGLVQLVLRKPLGAWWGDRVVLRDASASRALAGGRVLDPAPPLRHRRGAQRLLELDALRPASADERLRRLLAVAPQGVDLQQFARAQGQPVGELPTDAWRCTDAHSDHALGGLQAETVLSQVLQALADFHAKHPDELGPDSARLRRLTQPRMCEPLWRMVLSRMQERGLLRVRGAFVHLPEHGERLTALDERLAQKVAPWLKEAGFEGKWVRDLAKDCDEAEPLLRVTLVRLSHRAELFQVVRDLYYPAETMNRMVEIVRGIAAEHGGDIQAAQFRDATGLGRKRAIQVLEYLDRVGLLRRIGDTHRLRTDSLWLLPLPG